VGSAKYRSTRGALAFDAYYVDEWGLVNGPTNCSVDGSDRSPFHKSRFTTVVTGAGAGPAEVEAGWRFSVKNPANPRTNSGLKDKSNPVPSTASDDIELQLYASAQTSWYAVARLIAGGAWTKPVKVTLFHAVGTELNRHGLRSFIETGSGLQVVILIPGIEPTNSGDPRWGQTVSTAQIAAALKAGFGQDVPFTVAVLAAYSTGSCGLNQLILNELITLSQVRRVVFFDCLYSSQCGNTAAALKLVKARAGGDLRIVVYQTSEAGNSYVGGTSQLAVVANNPGLIDSRGVIANLFQSARYQALIVHRGLQSAVLDNVITLDKPLVPLYDAMTTATASLPRGTFVSRKDTYTWVHGSLPTGSVLFEDFAKGQAKVLDAFAKKLGTPTAKGTFRHALWSNRLPGWAGGLGEEKHDLLLPDFGWEYLLG